jgi:2-dehydropantoate 2-reductase
VVGAGSVGSVFGGRLAVAGHDVWLVHRRREVVNALRRTGLRLDSRTGTEQIAIQATDAPAEIGPVDLVLVLTKSADTRAAAESARPLVDDRTLVATLQNGLGNAETLAEVLGPQHVVQGLTYVGAALVGPGHARLTAPGQTFVGELRGGRSPRTENLARALTDAGMPTDATDDLLEMVWGKLVINAALNATAALTGASGTSALDSPAIFEMLGLVANETAAVAAALGITLPFADAAWRVRKHCADVGASKPSMLQDMEHGRPTEVDAINGAVVRAGTRAGVPTPYNQALLLLVRGREQVSAGGGAQG